MRASDLQPRHRVVLLGASNLTRGISTVVETAQNLWGAPLEVLAALGLGRAYGLSSSVLGRTLPGILQCGLWETLARRPKLPTTALVTDIGNDLILGADVPQVVAWVETVLERLQTADARITMTLLPLESILRLSPWRFHLFGALFFPGRKLNFAELLWRARELHDRLESLGRSHGVHLVEQQATWYGFDPIHIRLRHWRTAWPEILAASQTDAVSTPVRGSLRRWIYLRTRTAEKWQLFGIQRGRAQPCGRLKDGTTVAFY